MIQLKFLFIFLIASNLANASSYESDVKSSFALLHAKFAKSSICMEQFPDLKEEQKQALVAFQSTYAQGIYSIEKAALTFLALVDEKPKAALDHIKLYLKDYYLEQEPLNKNACIEHSRSMQNNELEFLVKKTMTTTNTVYGEPN